MKKGNLPIPAKFTKLKGVFPKNAEKKDITKKEESGLAKRLAAITHHK